MPYAIVDPQTLRVIGSPHARDVHKAVKQGREHARRLGRPVAVILTHRLAVGEKVHPDLISSDRIVDQDGWLEGEENPMKKHRNGKEIKMVWYGSRALGDIKAMGTMGYAKDAEWVSRGYRRGRVLGKRGRALMYEWIPPASRPSEPWRERIGAPRSRKKNRRSSPRQLAYRKLVKKYGVKGASRHWRKRK